MSRPKLLVLGIDGFCERVFEHCTKETPLPTFSKLLSGGLTAPLRSTLLPTSGSAWTSMVTGVNPGKHGITGFSRWELKDHIPSMSGLFTSHDVSIEYFWETLERSAGVKSLVLRVPCTFPPRPFGGTIVSEEDFSIATVSPSSLQPIVDHPLNKMPEHWLGAGWEKHAAEVVRKTARLTRSLYEETKPDVCFVVFYVLDFVHHRVGYDSDLFLELAKITDESVESLVGMDEFTDIVMVSDHGMRLFEKQFLLEAWLLSQGYMAWDKPNSCPDWKKTRLYCTPSDIPGNYGKIFVNRELVSEVESIRLLAEVRQRLLEPNSEGEALAVNVWGKDELYSGPFIDRMPDLVFRGPSHVRVVSMWSNEAALSPEFITSRSFLNAGCHAREGIFAWNGPGIDSCVIDDGLDIVDVGAFILSRYGVSLPFNYDGRVPDSVAKVTSLFANPGTQEAFSPQTRGEGELREKDRIIESLKELGYM